MNELYFTRVMDQTRGLFSSSPRPLGTNAILLTERERERERERESSRRRQGVRVIGNPVPSVHFMYAMLLFSVTTDLKGESTGCFGRVSRQIKRWLRHAALASSW